MATTVIQAFEDFRTKLEITSNQTTNVSTRQQNVRKNVGAKLTVLDDFLTGSYMRSTMIAPLKDADVDVFIVLDPSHYDSSPNGPANVLANVKRVIDNAYTEATEASRNGQAITIKFSDFKVDVVPAFNRQGGGYLIPDPVGKRWISTNPKTHVQQWSDSNKFHDYRLVPFIKMVKAWNRAHSRRFRSFHLETMIRQIFESRKIGAYADTAFYFFESAYNNLLVSDPAGLGGALHSYMSQDVNEMIAVRASLTSAATKAREAIAFNKAGDNAKAIGKWGVTFGDYFPAYG
jgi:Second Messenger Oligonucleotide or Dinucleotide Synthetase domain